MKAVNRFGSKFLRCVLRRMKALGLNQTALTKRMNASRPYVVKVLHGDVNITFETAARVLMLPTYYGLAPEDAKSIAENVLEMV